MNETIDGNAVAKSIHAELGAELANLKFSRPPCVAFIRVGEDPASVSYVKKKGRVAEEIVIQDITTGASNDLQRVTEMAKKMVTQWGMSEEVGLVTYGGDGHPIFLGRDYEARNDYSEEVASVIDKEIHRIIETAHKRATDLLTENRAILDNMSRVLVEKETIYSDEVDLLMEGKDYKEVIAYMEEKEGKAQENPFKRFTSEKE